MLIGYASAARHYEGLTILNHSDLGGERSMLIGYALIARQKGGLSFMKFFLLSANLTNETCFLSYLVFEMNIFTTKFKIENKNVNKNNSNVNNNSPRLPQ